MRPPLRLTSNDNPRAKAVVALRQQKERRTSNLFVAEGVREVGRALASGLMLRELYFHEQTLGVTYDGLAGLIPQLDKVEWAFENGKGASLFEVNTGVLAKMSYCERPEGIIGVFQQPKWTVESLIKDPGVPALWLIAVGTTKPGNLGAMARSLAAAGGQGILTSDAAVDPFNPNALRASTGAVLSLPILSMPGEEVRSLCKNQGVTIAVTSPRAKMDYSKLDLTKPIAFAIGAEDTGLDLSWLSAGKGKKADGIVEVGIPMARGVVDSLNASTAAAVLLFEAVRQRRSGKA
jgi:TrmH family RNA methyltransferase